MEAALAQGRFQHRPRPDLIGVQRDRPRRLGRHLGRIEETVHAPRVPTDQALDQQRRRWARRRSAAAATTRAPRPAHAPLGGAEGRRPAWRGGARRLGLRRRLDESPHTGAGLLAGAGRHHRIQHLTPSAKIVIGHPAHQAHQVVVEQRLVVEDFGQFLDGPGRRRLGETNAVTDGGAVAAAERGADALADGDGIFQVGTDGVSEGVVERPVEDDIGEQAGDGRRRRFVQAEQGGLNGLGHDRLRGARATARTNTAVLYSAPRRRLEVGCRRRSSHPPAVTFVHAEDAD